MSATPARYKSRIELPPCPPTHIVQFYEKDDFLVESVARFLDPTLAAGGVALVVASKAHRDSLADELKARGLNIEAATQEGRYVALDAAAVLAQFMIEGWPDEVRCREVLSELIKNVATSAQDSVAVFGEMVALLWADEKREAAVRLEQIWNELAESHSFDLFCAYPMDGFDQEKAPQAVLQHLWRTFAGKSSRGLSGLR